jgi:hypothetical protein
MSQREFYERLASELIDNNFDVVGLRRRQDDNTAADSALMVPVTGYGPRATPTKKTKKRKNGEDSGFRAQRTCKACNKYRTIKKCSECRDLGLGNFPFAILVEDATALYDTTQIFTLKKLRSFSYYYDLPKRNGNETPK